MVQFDYSTTKARKIDANKLPARLITVGGSSYAIGTTIHIAGFANFPNPSDENATYLGACGIINETASQPVSLNALMGRYYGENGRESVENGLPCGGPNPTESLSFLVDKTIKVKELVTVRVKRYQADGNGPIVESTMPVFELVGGAAEKTTKGKK